MTDIEILIKNLKMIAHPEGGHFSESFRDEHNNFSLIYYLLQRNEWSHWHRLTKNETLHFYKGDPLIIYSSKDEVNYNTVIIGEKNNFITTVDSGQPFFSKWWCIGAILNILFPVSL